MNRHDLLVQTAAPHRGPTGWFAPGATATIITYANLTDAVVVEAQLLPGRRPHGEGSTPNTAVRGRHLTRPNRKSP